jgi:hypothetical protein
MNTLANVFRKLALPVAAVLVLSAGGSAQAKTFVLPHILEKSGTINSTPYTFDTTIFAKYASGVACIGPKPPTPNAVYLYDDSGKPMRGLDGSDVCNPCAMDLDPTHSSAHLNIEDLFTPSGGMQGVKLGFGIVVVGGADPDAVHVQGFVVNSHTGPFDLSVFGFDPVEIRAPAKSGAALPCGRVFTAGNLPVSPGVAGGTPYSFDTTMFMTYTAGLAGTPSGGGATVDVYLYDEATGQLLGDATGTPVCNPCSVTLDDAHRKESFRLNDRIAAGAVVGIAVGAVCVVSGDPDNVAIQAFVVNTHSGPFDLSIFGPPMQEVTSNIASGVPAELAERLGLRNYPNPFNPRTTFAYTLPEAAPVTVRVFNAEGALVRTLLSDAQGSGAHELAWDGQADNGQAVPSGVYFGRIDAGGHSETQKVMLVK